MLCASHLDFDFNFNLNLNTPTSTPPLHPVHRTPSRSNPPHLPTPSPHRTPSSPSSPTPESLVT